MSSFVTPPNATDSRRGIVINADDVAIFDSLLLELDGVQFKMNAEFDENSVTTRQVGTAKLLKPHVNARYSNARTSAGPVCIEVIDTNVLPFPLDLVRNTLWECRNRQDAQTDYAVHHSRGEPMTTFAFKVNVDVDFNGQHISLEYLNVDKVHIDAGHTVFIWKSRTKVHPNFPDMHIDETGWQVMKPVDILRSEELSDSVTEILSCSRLECETFRGSLNEKNQRHGTNKVELTSLLVSALEEDLMQVNAMMLDMLLQDKPPASPSRVLCDDFRHADVNLQSRVFEGN